MDSNFDLLGSFYLGKHYNLKNKKLEDLKYLYESKDLQTHATILGMTGSGKTGLGISILEEAALDSIPSLVVDPKGDMANLALVFPDFKDSSFKKWVEADSSATLVAENWKKGTEAWDQNSARLEKLKESAQVKVYTPGADYGISISILSFLKSTAGLKKAELAERASNAASSLLGLMGVSANLNSSEHVLISNILLHKWKLQESLTIESLIALIASPPFTKVGVLNLEEFFTKKERKQLALQLNNLLASPRFSSWLQGESLNIDKLLFGENSKPQISIFCISHLNEEERIFFVALLLNELLSWMRKQKGSKALRALFYMDEVFGYLPPSANPATKEPLLTLLKQARAFGLGLVLSTQNPVDLDYKALSNMGTWFIGRMQTDQDKERIMEGLKVGLSQSELSELRSSISNLPSRVFIAKNIHEKAGLQPFHVRWALSYLRGPLDKSEIATLMKTEKHRLQTGLPQTETAAPPSDQKQIPSSDIPQKYLQTRAQEKGPLFYAPSLFVKATIFVDDKAKGIRETLDIAKVLKVRKGQVAFEWEHATPLLNFELGTDAKPAGVHAPAPEAMFEKKWFQEAAANLEKWLFQGFEKHVYFSPTYKKYSTLEEDEESFRARLSSVSRERRDEEKENLKKAYEKKFKSLEKKIQTANAKVEREADQAKSAKIDTFVSLGSTILGAFLGRKAVSLGSARRGAGALRKGTRAYQQTKDVQRAQEELELLELDLGNLEEELKQELSDIERNLDPRNETVEKAPLKVLKSNIEIKDCCLLWLPYSKVSDFEMEALW